MFVILNQVCLEHIWLSNMFMLNYLWCYLSLSKCSNIYLTFLLTLKHFWDIDKIEKNLSIYFFTKIV